jgi:pimeloyl-ACP methyl ester carboxylesterase
LQLWVLDELQLEEGGTVSTVTAPAGTSHARSRTLIRFKDVLLPTGVRMRYAEQGELAGRPILMLHGYSDSWFSFSRVLPLLPPAYHVFALDLRGHGESQQPAGGYTMREMAADVIAFMNAMKISRATIVGHSMGSFIAQQVALAAPRRVARLVLVGSATMPRVFTGFSELEREVYAIGETVPIEFVREFQYGTVHVDVPADFMDRAIMESMKLPPTVWRSIMDGMMGTDRPEQLEGSPIPTLIAWGDHDNFAPRSEQDALLAMLPRSVLKVYDETGHAVHWDRPEPFARDLEAFIAGRMPR